MKHFINIFQNSRDCHFVRHISTFVDHNCQNSGIWDPKQPFWQIVCLSCDIHEPITGALARMTHPCKTQQQERSWLVHICHMINTEIATPPATTNHSLSYTSDLELVKMSPTKSMQSYTQILQTPCIWSWSRICRWIVGNNELIELTKRNVLLGGIIMHNRSPDNISFYFCLQKL